MTNKQRMAETAIIRLIEIASSVGSAVITSPPYPAVRSWNERRMLPSETPRAIPKFLLVAITLDAVDSCSFGSAFMMAVLLGDWKSPKPIPKSMNATIIPGKERVKAQYERRRKAIVAIPIPSAA